VVVRYSLSNGWRRDDEHSGILGLEIYKAKIDVIFTRMLMFFTHMPATVRSELAGFDLQQHGLSFVKEVDEDVDFAGSSRRRSGKDTALEKSR
jgi:hypothetical protein